MSEVIQSPANPKIKRLLRLREKRAREREGVILVEGRPEIDRYLETGYPVKEVYICPELVEDKDFLERLKVLVAPVTISRSAFTKLAYGHRLEGLVLVVPKPEIRAEDIPQKKQALFVVLEHLEKPGNLGAILRSADGVGADAVLVADPNVDVYNPNVIRASLGTIFSRPVLVSSNEEVLAFLKKRKVTVFAAAPEAAENYAQENLTSSAALVVGSEDKGLSDFWLQAADRKIRIPMRGKADSLNASVSTAIILYEILRQRNV